MEEVKAENKILLEDLAERNDTRIVECENNIKQVITENNNEIKQHIAEVKGEFMRKFEELEAIVKGSAKQDPNTNFRIEHDSTRKIHVACQVEADDIDEHLTIKNLLDPSIVATDESGDGDFKIVNVKQKCILLELTASPEILSSEEQLLNAIDQLINRVVLAGNLDTRVPGKMTLNLAFTSPLSREEQDVFSKVFCNSDKAENIHSDVLNQFQDCSIGTVTRETQTEENLVDSAHSFWDINHAMIKDLHTTVDILSKANVMLKERVVKDQKDNLSLEKGLKTLAEEKERNLDLIKGLHTTLDRVSKENVMLKESVFKGQKDKLSLERGLKTLTKEKERNHAMIEDLHTTLDIVRKTNKKLKAKIDEYKKENLSLKTDPKTLSKEMKRSKSPCYLSNDEEKMKLRPQLMQHQSRETKGQQQHVSQDQAESVYDFGGKSRSLQSETQKVHHTYNLQNRYNLLIEDVPETANTNTIKRTISKD